MAWYIKFIPDEVTSMSISCNGVHALDWSSAEGEVTKPVPAQWANLPHVHFFAEGSPNGRNAHCKYYWDADERHEASFDDGEDWDS